MKVLQYIRFKFYFICTRLFKIMYIYLYKNVQFQLMTYPIGIDSLLYLYRMKSVKYIFIHFTFKTPIYDQNKLKK